MMALSESSSFKDFVFIFVDLVQAAIPLVASAALLVFFWGLAKFIFQAGAGDSKGNKEGKDLMVYGGIALFVMISIWGILRFVYNDINLPGNPGALGIPVLPRPGN